MWKLDQYEIVWKRDKQENAGVFSIKSTVPGKPFKEIREGDWIVGFDRWDGLDYQKWDGDLSDGFVAETADGYRHVSTRSDLVWAMAFDGSTELSDDLDEQRIGKGDVIVVWYEDAEGGVAPSQVVNADAMPFGFKTKLAAAIVDGTFVTDDGHLEVSTGADDFSMRCLSLGGKDTVVHKVIVAHGSNASYVK